MTDKKLALILFRPLQTSEPSVGDEDHVQNAHVANGVVKRDVEVTEELAERPVAEHRVNAIVGYDNEADERVHKAVADEYFIKHGFILFEPVD